MFLKFARSRYSEEFLALTKGAGYSNPSSFESRVIPLCLHERDVVIEIPERVDITNALVLPCFQNSGDPDRLGTSVILVSSPEVVKAVAKQARNFSSRGSRPRTVAALGIDDNIRKEIPYLSRPTDIIVGTPERIIDHIRRDNLSLENVRRIVIELPPDFEEQGYDKDILFIYSKLTRKVHTILFGPYVGGGIPLSSILHHPQLATVESQAGQKVSYLCYRVQSEEAKQQLLADLFYAEEWMDAAVVCENPQTAADVVQMLAQEGLKAATLFDNEQPARYEEVSRQLLSGDIRTVATEALSPVLRLPSVRVVVFYRAPDDAQNYGRLKVKLASAGTCTTVVTLCAKDESNFLTGDEEVQSVDTTSSPSTEDVLKGRVRSIVKRIKEDGNPDELNKLRALVRRNVPISLRGYFMAYLLRESFGRPVPGPTAAPAADTKTLFVSIGKNRKVFPRDLSRLFSGALQIKPTMLGSIKVLDNYSFVDVPQELADKAIGLLDGSDFRGRKITVNHARKKEED